MFATRDLTLHYGQSRILNGVTVAAEQGDVTCIMGTNGVGKTSLLKAMSGRHPRSGGAVTLDGTELPRRGATHFARAGVAYVPQGREIFGLLTVRENLETGFACLPREERSVPEVVFELFPILKEMQNRRGGDLSGGQQQQLAIARALITRPRVLLLDEPTEGIQPSIIADIGRVIKRLREAGDMAIILVEQYFDFAHELADRICVLRRGSVVMEGEVGELNRDDVLSAVSV
jgi:urea transport system ATP-binding protein